MPDDPTPDRAAFDARLKALNARRDAERAEAERVSTGKSDWGMAVKLSSEFIAAVIVGGALGYGFDVVFGTTPWGFIALFLLGFGAATLNVMRAMGRAPQSKLNVAAVDEAARRAKASKGDRPSR